MNGIDTRRSWAAGFLALALLPAAVGIQLACSRGTTTRQESRAVPTPYRAGHWKGELHGDLMGRRESPVQRLIELRIQGVTPEFVRGMQAAGYRDLSPWDLIELHRQGVDPAEPRAAAAVR